MYTLRIRIKYNHTCTLMYAYICTLTHIYVQLYAYSCACMLTHQKLSLAHRSPTRLGALALIAWTR